MPLDFQSSKARFDVFRAEILLICSIYDQIKIQILRFTQILITHLHLRLIQLI